MVNLDLLKAHLNKNVSLRVKTGGFSDTALQSCLDLGASVIQKRLENSTYPDPASVLASNDSFINQATLMATIFYIENTQYFTNLNVRIDEVLDSSFNYHDWIEPAVFKSIDRLLSMSGQRNVSEYFQT